MKIYLDDIRFPRTEGWTVVRNYDDFLHTWALNKHDVTEISFDHDLGEGSKSGYDAVCLVEEDYFLGNITHKIFMNVHSANPVGARVIHQVIRKIYHFLDERK